MVNTCCRSSVCSVPLHRLLEGREIFCLYAPRVSPMHTLRWSSWLAKMKFTQRWSALSLLRRPWWTTGGTNKWQRTPPGCRKPLLSFWQILVEIKQQCHGWCKTQECKSYIRSKPRKDGGARERLYPQREAAQRKPSKGNIYMYLRVFFCFGVGNRASPHINAIPPPGRYGRGKQARFMMFLYPKSQAESLLCNIHPSVSSKALFKGYKSDSKNL